MTAIFHDMMHQELEDYVDDIVDDIVVKSRRREEHFCMLKGYSKDAELLS